MCIGWQRLMYYVVRTFEDCLGNGRTGTVCPDVVVDEYGHVCGI